jgi:O-antigen/teichoic acid export membrane protein
MIDTHIRALLANAAEPIQPMLSAMFASGDRQAMSHVYVRGGRYQMWASLFMAAPLVIFSHEFIRLYLGSIYMDAATVIVLLLAGYPFIFSNKMLFRLGLAQGRIRLITIGALLKQIVNLGITLYLVWFLGMGAVGSALGVFSSGLLLQLLFFWPLGLSLAEVSLKRFMSESVWLGMAPALAGGVVWVAMKYYVQPETWISLGLCTALGHLAYVGAILACLEPFEWEDLTHLYLKIRTRLDLFLSNRTKEDPII